MAKQVINILELRKTKIELSNNIEMLKEQNLALDRFASIAAHDIKSPLNSIVSLVEIFRANCFDQLDEEGKELMEHAQDSVYKLISLINSILKFAKSGEKITEDKEEIAVEELSKEINQILNADKKSKIRFDSELLSIRIHKTVIIQILINLIGNAIKYNDKEQIEIELKIVAKSKFYHFYVIDNGPGIPERIQEKIFEPFETGNKKDRNGEMGNGIGLATVKRLVQNSKGKIDVKSSEGNGSTFHFTIKR